MSMRQLETTMDFEAQENAEIEMQIQQELEYLNLDEDDDQPLNDLVPDFAEDNQNIVRQDI